MVMKAEVLMRLVPDPLLVVCLHEHFCSGHDYRPGARGIIPLITPDVRYCNLPSLRQYRYPLLDPLRMLLMIIPRLNMMHIIWHHV